MTTPRSPLPVMSPVVWWITRTEYINASMIPRKAYGQQDRLAAIKLLYNDLSFLEAISELEFLPEIKARPSRNPQAYASMSRA